MNKDKLIITIWFNNAIMILALFIATPFVCYFVIFRGCEVNFIHMILELIGIYVLMTIVGYFTPLEDVEELELDIIDHLIDE